MVVRNLRIAKKLYCAPALRILEPAAAKAKLEVSRHPQDADARQMLSVLKHRNTLIRLCGSDTPVRR
ncbi:MAG: hypothetical protein WBQ64_13415, partial [Terriglobales bacterium]